MRLTLFILFISFLTFSSYAQNSYSKEDQIKMALLAAPEDKREGAHIFGFDENGALVTLREGTNEMIVRSTNPKSPNFEVVCYHKSLEPFMARGRALRKEGKGRAEIFDIREKEMDNGSLEKPITGATLQIYYGGKASYDKENNKLLVGGKFRYVVYTPMATQESTGLPLKPTAPGHPWLMFPGLYRAHIMITPPDNN